jgi:tRNA nucleotidyltransferase (CCA-adding enzyme)
MNDIPKEVIAVVALLKHEGFEAYLVGGCVRDVLMNRTPKDWDVTTNALPEDIQRIFPHTFYENDFGTVGVVTDDATAPSLQVIEVTPYRKESGYSDKRHPDTVEFGTSLKEDLKRRDFTMNAIALDPLTGDITDPHKGQDDIEHKIVRTVGNAEERFGEDALRIMRAVRLAAELDFELSEDTVAAIRKLHTSLKDISVERIRDEFTKLILSPHPRKGIELMYELHLLQFVVPEVEEGVNVKQNQAHSYAVFEHIVRTLQAAADKNATLPVRLAALFHDIAKPHTKAFDDKKDDWSFHGHDVVGSKLTRKRLQALKYPSEIVDVVTKLVRWHMFFSDTDEITHSAVRRLVRNVGTDHIQDILLLRICDRVGTGRPKEEPYRLRKYQSMVAEVMRDPISVSMLAIDGADIMTLLDEKGGPRIGWILHALLEEVLDDPKRNTKEYLEERVEKLAILPDDELKKLGEAGKDVREEAEAEELKKLRSKYHVE